MPVRKTRLRTRSARHSEPWIGSGGEASLETCFYRILVRRTRYLMRRQKLRDHWGRLLRHHSPGASSPAEALRMVASIDLELNHLYKPDPLSVWRRVVFDEALEERTHRLTFSLGSALATCSRTATTLAGAAAVCFGLFFLMQHLIEQRASNQLPTGPDRIELVRKPRPESPRPCPVHGPCKRSLRCRRFNRLRDTRGTPVWNRDPD